MNNSSLNFYISPNIEPIKCLKDNLNSLNKKIYEKNKKNICVIQKCNTFNLYKKSKNDNQELNCTRNEDSDNSKKLFKPKTNLLESKKSLSNMSFIYNNINVHKSNSDITKDTIDYNFNVKNTNQKEKNKKKTEKSSEKNLMINSFIKLEPTINKSNNIDDLDNNSFSCLKLNDSTELLSSIGKEKLNINIESNIFSKCNNYGNQEKDLNIHNSYIEIKENVIIENPVSHEDLEDKLYKIDFNINENSDILNINNIIEYKDILDSSINDFNNFTIKDKSESSNSIVTLNTISNDKNKEKPINIINKKSNKDKKILINIKDNSNSYIKKNRIRDINSFAKSLSPNRLFHNNIKLISEIDSIKEVEENKTNSPEIKSNVNFKNIISLNNPTKMNLFCINKERIYLVKNVLLYFISNKNLI